MSRRSNMLEFAVLGLLRESPMHGYELRKRLNTLLGTFRAFSYGTLYPCLKALVAKGWIVEEDSPAAEPSATTSLLARQRAAGAGSGRRAKIVYRLTAEGKEHFEQLLTNSGPDAWEDEHFGVRFAFFGQTDRSVRMRVLEGRRTRLEERLEKMRAALARTRERLDDYTLELQRHGLESVEREVRWLNELIETERAGRESRRTAGQDRSEGTGSAGTGSQRGASASTGPQDAASEDSGSADRRSGSKGGEARDRRTGSDPSDTNS